MYRVSQLMSEILAFLFKINKLLCHRDIAVCWALWQRNSRRIAIKCAKNAPKNCDAPFWMPLILKRSADLTVSHGGCVYGCANSYCDTVCSGMREVNIVGGGANVSPSPHTLEWLCTNQTARYHVFKDYNVRNKIPKKLMVVELARRRFFPAFCYSLSVNFSDIHI